MEQSQTCLCLDKDRPSDQLPTKEELPSGVRGFDIVAVVVPFIEGQENKLSNGVLETSLHLSFDRISEIHNYMNYPRDEHGVIDHTSYFCPNCGDLKTSRSQKLGGKIIDAVIRGICLKYSPSIWEKKEK